MSPVCQRGGSIPICSGSLDVPCGNHFSCFQCLIFNSSITIGSSQTGFTDLRNFSNPVKKHASSPTHLSATTALTLLGKLRNDEAANEGAQLSRIMYSEQVRKIRFRLSKCNVPGAPLHGTRMAEGRRALRSRGLYSKF